MKKVTHGTPDWRQIRVIIGNYHNGVNKRMTCLTFRQKFFLSFPSPPLPSPPFTLDSIKGE